MDMNISFPVGKKVEASYKGFSIMTDQPVKAGGDGSAPSPFDLFLISLGTCAGIYVLSFCQQRNIPTENIKLLMKTIRNSEKGMIDKIIIDILLPSDFPEKYTGAVKSAADMCTIKKHILNPPIFEINTVKN